MKYELGDILFYKLSGDDDESDWAVYEIINTEETNAGILYTLKLKLSNSEFKKIENLLQKELDNLKYGTSIKYSDYKQKLILFNKDEDIMGQVTAHII